MRPEISYIICTTPRSGSVLLCDALASTGIAGYPEEYFYEASEPEWAARWGVANGSYAEYVDAALQHGSTRNGVFGAKMMWSLLDRFVSEMRSIPQYSGFTVPNMLRVIFPNLHYIWLTRRDKVAQAVSHWRAIQTGRWHVSAGGAPVPADEPRYSFEAIDHLVREAESHDRSWQHYFAAHGVRPCKVVYEEFVVPHDATVRDILAFLSIPNSGVSIAKARTAKQADSLSAEWVQRYRRTIHS
jgi:LPS sulfotransferase NodH